MVYILESIPNLSWAIFSIYLAPTQAQSLSHTFQLFWERIKAVSISTPFTFLVQDMLHYCEVQVVPKQFSHGNEQGLGAFFKGYPVVIYMNFSRNFFVNKD